MATIHNALYTLHVRKVSESLRIAFLWCLT